MYKLDLPIDKKGAAKIEFARQQEAERKTRIFGNERQRTIGLDYATLDKQAEEKKACDAQQRQEDQAAQLELIRQDKLICFLEQQKRAEAQKARNEEMEYRRVHQGKEKSREWDLNDMSTLKKTMPFRQGGAEDANLGMSSLQVFDGEDLGKKQRDALQSEQLKQWNQQQMDARACEKEEAADLVRLQALQAKQQVAALAEIQAEEARARHNMTQSACEENLRMAEEKAERKRAEFAASEQQKVDEMMKTINSEMLKEEPEAAYLPNGRVQVDKFRGFTQAQLEGIRARQAVQIEELKSQQAAEKQFFNAHASQAAMYDRAAVLAQRKADKARKEQDRQNAIDNFSLASQTRLSRSQELATMKGIKPEEAFFTQFGTTTR